MMKKRLWGATIIGVIEVLFGLYGFNLLVQTLTYEGRTGKVLGMGGLLLPIYVVWTCFVLLGLGMLLQKKAALIIHLVFIVFATLALIFTTVFVIGEFYAGLCMMMGWCIIVAIPLIYYLTRPKIREQFR
ncbi:MAG: hypothetical protein V1883_00765 [Candidatus Omnitrophota bacterium]